MGERLARGSDRDPWPGRLGGGTRVPLLARLLGVCTEETGTLTSLRPARVLPRIPGPNPEKKASSHRISAKVPGPSLPRAPQRRPRTLAKISAYASPAPPLRAISRALSRNERIHGRGIRAAGSRPTAADLMRSSFLKSEITTGTHPHAGVLEVAAGLAALEEERELGLPDLSSAGGSESDARDPARILDELHQAEADERQPPAPIEEPRPVLFR